MIYKHRLYPWGRSLTASYIGKVVTENFYQGWKSAHHVNQHSSDVNSKSRNTQNVFQSLIV